MTPTMGTRNQREPRDAIGDGVEQPHMEKGGVGVGGRGQQQREQSRSGKAGGSPGECWSLLHRFDSVGVAADGSRAAPGVSE